MAGPMLIRRYEEAYTKYTCLHVVVPSPSDRALCTHRVEAADDRVKWVRVL